MFNSPLEQFELICLISLNFHNFYFSITNSTLVVLMILALMVLILFFFSYVCLMVVKWHFLVINNLFVFSRMLIVENVGIKYVKYITLIFFLFLFLFLSNILGMIPYSFTVTSQFIFTFALALIFFFGVTYIGFVKHRLHFFGLFLPDGAPLAIMPFIVTIEIISYIARVFSLSIRLFANMMAGHTLLNILAWFCWSMFLALGIWLNIGIFPLIIIFLVTGLEMAIAFLQAYVFTVLVCIYLNDVIHLH
jgi:ATP synthase subunit 6